MPCEQEQAQARAQEVCRPPLFWLLLSSVVAATSTSTTPTLTTSDCSVVAGRSDGVSSTANEALNQPMGVTVEASGDLLVADTGNHRVMRWQDGGSSGTRVAGTGNSTALDQPLRVAIQSDGSFAISEYGANRIAVWAEGASTVTAWAPTQAGYPPLGIALDSDGNMLVGHYSVVQAIRRYVPGSSSWMDRFGHHSENPKYDVVIGSDGLVYVTDTHGVLRYGPPDTVVALGTRIAGAAQGSAANEMNVPRGLALDAWLGLWVADTANGRVLKCPGTGTVDPCEVMLSGLSMPWDIDLSSSQSHFYVPEQGNNRVWKCPTLLPTSTATSTTSSTSSMTSSTSSSSSTSTTSVSTSTTTSSTATRSSTSTTTASSTTSTRTSSSSTSSSSRTTSTSSTTSSSTTSMSTSSTTSSSSTSSSTRSTSTSTTTSSSSTSSSFTISSTSTTTRSSSTSSSTRSTSTSSTTSSSSTSSSTRSTLTWTTSSSSSSSSSSSMTRTTSSSSTLSSVTITTSLTTSSSTTRTSSLSSGSSSSSTLSSTRSSSTATTTSSSSSMSRTFSTSGSTTTSSEVTVSSTVTTNTSDNTSSGLTTTSAGVTSSLPPTPTPAPPGPPSPEVAVAELLSSVADVSAGLLGQLKDTGGDQSSSSFEGGSLTALRLGPLESLANFSEDSISLAMEGPSGPLELTLPHTLFADLPASSTSGDSLVFVFASFSPLITESLGGQHQTQDASGKTPEVEVLSAVSIDLTYLLSGEALEVSGLQKPIVFQLPRLNYSDGLRCAYWKEEEKLWSFEGVSTNPGLSPGEPMTCSTNHLSFFAAIREILQGFIETWQCAQFDLLSAEAIRNVFTDTQWPYTRGAWTCWGVLITLAVAAVAAVFIDHSRGRTQRWKDEFFLVAMGDAPKDAEADADAGADAGASAAARPAEAPEPEVQEEEAEEEGKEAASQKPAALALALGLAGAATCVRCMWESSALREAVDEILGSWFEYWSQVRNSCENICAVLGEGLSSDAASATICHRATATLVMASSRRLVAASLGMTNDAVIFVLEDEDLQEFIMASPPNAVVGTRADNWRTSEDQRVAWTALHDTVVHHVLLHTERHTVCGLPEIVLQFLLYHNPFGALFLCDIFYSCKKRVLLLAVDVLGAMAFSCLFFNAAGMVRGKPLRSDLTCGPEGQSMLWMLGRCTAIATGSLLVSSVPTAVIGSLSTKGFRKLDYRGSEKWQRQLQVWAIQEMIVWAFALLYASLCLCFVLVFLASIGSEDHGEWTTAELLGLGEDFLFLPMLVALFVPGMTASFLHLSARVLRTDRQTVVRRTHEALLRQTSLMLPIMRA